MNTNIELSVGDWLKFKTTSKHHSSSRRSYWRKVRSLWHVHGEIRPVVLFDGWPMFSVRQDEIKGMEKAS